MPRAIASVFKARVSTELASMTMQPMVMFASHGSRGEAALSLESPTMVAYAEQVVPSVAGANLVVYPLGVAAIGLTGGIGPVSAAIEPMTLMASNRPYGSAAMSMSPLLCRGSAHPADVAYLFSGLYMRQDVTPVVDIGVLLSSDFSIAGVIEFDYSPLAEMPSEMSVSSINDVEALLGVSMRDIAKLFTDATVFSADASVYCVNRMTGSTTRYEHFDFTKYLNIAGYSYGVKSDGVYLIGAETDDGQAIRASVDFGKQDFNTRKHKLLSSAYVTLSSAGTLQLKITDDTGKSYMYGVAESGRHNTVRSDLGRGLKANYYELQLYNEDGAAFDISDIELLVAESTRRV